MFHGKIQKIISWMGLGLLLLVSSACSMGRKSSAAGLNKDRLSQAVLLNRVLDQDVVYDHLGEFQLQLNLDKNFAYLDVLAMGEGWNPDNQWHSYRILARRHNDGQFWLLAKGLRAGPGETIEVDAHVGHKIFEYVEWIVQFEYSAPYVKAAYGDLDTRIVQDTIYWPELDDYLAKTRR
jgi:hypothetical protein